MKLIRNLTPADYVSISGILFIWIAIIHIIHNDAFGAIIFTFLAFFIDMIDGWIARKTGKASSFGLQLDTIIDTLNYPIFSALFAYQFIFNQSFWGSITALFILAFGSLRLTRMAIDGIKEDTEEKRYYEGVVTPHILVANSVLYYLSVFYTPIPQIVSACILIPLSIGMVSTIRVYKPKNLSRVILFAIFLLAISFYGKFLR